jgi:hypothetical protein
MTTQHKQTKDKFIEQKHDVDTKIARLRPLQDANKRNADIARSKEYLEDRALWAMEVNGSRVEISEEYTVPIKFSCGHAMRVSLDSLLPLDKPHVYHGLKHGSTIEITGSLNCEQCKRKAHDKLIREHLYTQKRLGFANWRLRYLR